jgi:phenylacetate-CoA ligase
MFEPDAESMPPEQLADLQQRRLRGLIDRLLGAGGVQATRLREAGVARGADVALEEISRLPMTVKDDLWTGYPFGMLAVPLADVVTVHGSSGTGGRPTLVGYTGGDLRLWARMCARALRPAVVVTFGGTTPPGPPACHPLGPASGRPSRLAPEGVPDLARDTGDGGGL